MSDTMEDRARELMTTNDWINGYCTRVLAAALTAAHQAGVEQTATAILGAYGIDGHVFGSRPCPTCRKMTEILGAPFGCVAATIRAHPQCQPPTKEGGKE